jgi:hypothetical protein
VSAGVRRFNRDNWSAWSWLVVAVLTAGALGLAAGSSLASRQYRTPVGRHHRGGRHHPGAHTRTVLRANRIGRVRFGSSPAVAIRDLDHLLSHRPTERFHVIHACGADHAIGWPGLVVFFRGRRFVAYSYRPANGAGRVPTLATARGLRVGDTLAVGKHLYGAGFHASRSRGGTWWATTPEGRVEGLASGWPDGPRGSVATIAGGDVSCPAITP